MKSYWVEAGDMLMHKHHNDMIEVRLSSEVREEMISRKYIMGIVNQLHCRCMTGNTNNPNDDILCTKHWLLKNLELDTKPIAEIEKELK
jgi:hypothetical protein